MHDDDSTGPLPHSPREETLESLIRRTIAKYKSRGSRLYRIALTIRVLIVLCSFLALLPDSSSFYKFDRFADSYGVVTTVAGILGALLFLVAKNIKLAENYPAALMIPLPT